MAPKSKRTKVDLVQARYGSRVIGTKGKGVRKGGLVHPRHPRIQERMRVHEGDCSCLAHVGDDRASAIGMGIADSPF